MVSRFIRYNMVRSFQFRLLAYLFVIGTIPLICAIVVFYWQSSSYAKEELESSVFHTHSLIIERLKDELQTPAKIAYALNNDFVVQQFIADGPEGNGDSRDYIDRLLRSHADHSNYIEAICLSNDEHGWAICPDNSLMAGAPVPVNALDVRFIGPTSDDHRVQSGRIRLVGALYEQSNKVVRGRIILNFNLDKLLRDIQRMSPVNNHLVFNETGQVIAALEEAELKAMAGEFIEHAKGYQISQQHLYLLGLHWTSSIVTEHQRLSASWHSLQQTLIISFIMLLIVSVISAIIFARSVTSPIHHLRKLMKRAESGDLKAYWTYEGTDEINLLGDSYNQMLNRLEKLIKQVRHEESLKKEFEMEALQNQFNPHFLYNTLNTIKWVAKIQQVPQISDAVSALVKLMQASLGKTGEFITLTQEIDLIKSYMHLQSFRFGQVVQLELEIAVNTETCLVPRLILQPLVENALLHGFEGAQTGGTIRISSWFDRDILICEVADNGKGMTESERRRILKETTTKMSGRDHMSGLGLKHIREKIKLYYGPHYSMNIISDERRGTKIRLMLPIHHDEEGYI